MWRLMDNNKNSAQFCLETFFSQFNSREVININAVSDAQAHSLVRQLFHAVCIILKVFFSVNL